MDFFQFEIIINVLVSSFSFIWIHILGVYHVYGQYIFLILSVRGPTLDVRFWRLKPVPTLKGSILGHCRNWWPNIRTALGQRISSTGIPSAFISQNYIITFLYLVFQFYKIYMYRPCVTFPAPGRFPRCRFEPVPLWSVPSDTGGWTARRHLRNLQEQQTHGFKLHLLKTTGNLRVQAKYIYTKISNFQCLIMNMNMVTDKKT